MKRIAIAMLKAGKEEEQVIVELRLLKSAVIAEPVAARKVMCLTEKVRTVYSGKLVNFHITRLSINRGSRTNAVSLSKKYAVDSS